ncbi:hypothetical protein OH77DRAFT_1446201 [Trametes cingulata]|nr:hypothetical protein OH77DRAFT_1446201 [Trametes cingulata]
MEFSLLDAMHNLFLGELRHHCRNVWGINDKENYAKSGGVTAHSPEEQKIWLERVVNSLKKGSSISRVRRGYIVAIGQLNGVLPPSCNWTKDKCIKVLVKWWGNGHASGIQIPPVLSEPTADFHLVEGEHMRRTYVLDQPTLAQIRKDIGATYLPSWLERPPRNFGSASHGKLKADHWRTVCTVSMVITLVRLWGSAGSTQKEKLLLENFVHLVSAVKLATRRSVDLDRIAEFDHHMKAYLDTLATLFPWHQLVPNHHLSLHLRECLERFGPVHAWWAFPFERFNGVLQRLNTNSKSNAMPLTFMRYFYLGANVRWVMATTEWPDEGPFRNMMQAFEETFRDAARGTRVADVHPIAKFAIDTEEFAYNEKAATDLPRDVYEKLLSCISRTKGPSYASLFAPLSDNRPRLSTLAQHVSTVKHHGLSFATAGRRKGDSFILFDDDTGNEHARPSPRAGQIEDIILHVRVENGKRTVEPFFMVAEFTPLADNHVAVDPFRQFPGVETRLCYARCKQDRALIALSDIRAHFAAYIYEPAEIGENCIVVCSLDRS